jgi:class 3 adenylate cyclase/tetratricopeptide (TPR) repeat protein
MSQKTVISEMYKRGDLARAHDLCLLALRQAPDDLWLRHRAVLCLVRSGALERAEAEYRSFGLADARLDEDCLALGARLLKARTFEAPPDAFRALALRTAAKYADVFGQTRGHYPGINAASMYLLAGEPGRAKRLAAEVLKSCSQATGGEGEQAYYSLASQAEAHLLLGDTGAAHIALRAAIAMDRDNNLAHATTIQQLRLILTAQGRVSSWLTDLEPPKACHYAGHIFRLGSGTGALETAAEARLAAAIAETLEQENIGSAFGAIAAGSDIMIAEAALRRDSELHIALPLPVGPFIDASVRPFGAEWVRRCEACLDAANSIQELTTDRRMLTDAHIRFASDVAMGLARIRADVLASSPLQLLVWDGSAGRGPYGTAQDAARWLDAGLPQRIVEFAPEHRCQPDQPAAETESKSDYHAVLRAMIFVDVRGSSTIADDDVPVFVDQVLGRLADVCDSLDVAPVYADSWGDGLFLAFEQVTAAADAAHTLRAAFAEIDLTELGLPGSLALRIGGHFGPAHEGQDRLQGRASLFGAHVAMASRIEGVAVPGSIFVSTPFAALLAMSKHSPYRCEYVGQKRVDPLMPEVPLYSLRAVAKGSVAARDGVSSIGAAQPV